ncbi:MAG: respiratory chain complex I subunit 1 family protein [Cuniculiplasma divulgatum]|nr:MAG: respiratory chain complex I subunit 1 family protein [Cuniculiplasma divulgatum]
MDMITLAETLTQYFFVVLSAPLYAGILAKLKGMVESRRGSSIFQPYYDLWKLFRKVTIIPVGSGVFFRYIPYVLFGIYSLIALIIPVLIPVPIYFTASGDFLSGAILFSLAAFLKTAAAMNSGSNYVALGVSRSMSFNFLSEGTLITVFIAVSLLTATNNPYTTNAFLVSHSLENLSLAHIFSTLAFFMLFFYETGKIPLESSGVQELGMIDEGLNYEYSGKLLAINRWSSYIKQYLLGSVLLNVFLVPWGLFSSSPYFLLDIPVMIAKWMLLILIVLVVETTLAKLRLFRVMDYLATAFTFSILFLIFAEVIP